MNVSSYTVTHYTVGALNRNSSKTLYDNPSTCAVYTSNDCHCCTAHRKQES